MTDRTPDPAPLPAPLPATGGSWIRDAEGRLRRAPAPKTDDAPARPRKPSPVKEG